MQWRTRWREEGCANQWKLILYCKRRGGDFWRYAICSLHFIHSNDSLDLLLDYFEIRSSFFDSPNALMPSSAHHPIFLWINAIQFQLPFHINLS
jgi:hypothetical protein